MAAVLGVVATILPAGGVRADYPWSGFQAVDANSPVGAGSSMSVNPDSVTWDGLRVTWTGVAGVDHYEVAYQDSTYMVTAVVASVVAGPNTAGVSLAVWVQDQRLAGHRVRYEVVARDAGGGVVGAAGFEVVHAVAVSLDYWSVKKLAQAIADALAGLLEPQPGSPGYTHLTNTMSTLTDYGPWGEAKRASDRVTQLVGEAQGGDHPAVAALQEQYFTFPFVIEANGQVYTYYFTLPFDRVLQAPGWSTLWTVVSATMWVSFVLWLIQRLSPKNQT